MKKILINDSPWQTRVAITRDDELQNIYFWSHSSQNLERSFYKGTVIKVLPGIQTAFVDIGQERSGFLHISEIDRELAIEKMDIGDHTDEIEPEETLIEPKPEHITKQQMDISKIFNEGENILVQVSKEPVYEKGAKLTTCFTLPGRFIVLMPNIPRIGISKKIESKEERQRLKDILKEHLPEGMGAIIRTPSENKEGKEILQDLSYLLDIWQTILNKYKNAKPKEKIYEDIDMPLQIVRDHLDNDVELVITDSRETLDKITRFVKTIAPDQINKIRFYEGPPSLFDKYNIETQIEQALNKKVHLKSGGSIIIETTEAMTVIDVNTGRYIGQTNLEDTILKTNLEAAEEIVRQLRLRNIGGLIVIDFIDMFNQNNKQKLYKVFEKTLKERDKFQSVVLKVSEFGLVQMTRKRSGKTLIQQLTQACPVCQGLGFVKSIPDESFSLLRRIKQELTSRPTKDGEITLELHPTIFKFLTTHEYNSILTLEKKYNCKIILISKEQCLINQYALNYISSKKK